MKKGIERIYSEVAPSYELVNHVLTLGWDILWRKQAAKTARRLGGSEWMDICSGTGELALNLSRSAAENTNIIAVDGSLPMLSLAKRKTNMSRIRFSIADAGNLPFTSDTFDLITISFATRNLNASPEVLSAFLREFFRVLKPGGTFINLETSQPRSPLLKKLFHWYVKLLVKPVGYMFSGSKAGYSYLSYTIPRFYSAQEFTTILQDSGFANLTHKAFLGGIAALHTGQKIANSENYGRSYASSKA